jgi:hypothetical protein
MRKGCAAFAFACLLAFPMASPAQWFREVQVSSEPELNGKKDYTVKFAPQKTHDCERIVFECVYHQEFPWEDVRGKKYTKVSEPVVFTYRRLDVKFVNELDNYLSFKVPVSLPLLEEAYGPRVFNKQHPVSIPRIRIAAYVQDKPIWAYELKTESKFDGAALQTLSILPAEGGSTNSVSAAKGDAR